MVRRGQLYVQKSKLATDNPFALGDRRHFETLIKPYTCFVGIYIRLKKVL